VIAALHSRGLWFAHGNLKRQAKSQHEDRSGDRPSGRDDATRSEVALTIWAAAMPASGTPVENYLRGRGLSLPVPGVLRYHPALKHPSGSVWPGMVALVMDGLQNLPVAIHRTFLSRDGRKAPVEPVRMMLGRCHGGAVHLAAADSELLVGEGIETCLAALQATRRPAWAALSTSGLRVLNLPPQIRTVIVLADGDSAGEAAARAAALRWKEEGRNARIARAPRGLDFNDLLVGRVLSSERVSHDR